MRFGFAALAAAGALVAQGPPAQNLTPHMLKPDVYWLEGGGGNTGVIVGKAGVIIIDAKTTPAAGKMIIDEVAKITPKPITTVILTHSDGDHVNGLASFPAGLTIIAQENNKKEQEAALKAGGRGAPPADRLPTQLVTKEKETENIDGVKFEFYHWAPAHTSGDLVIYLPADKIVFTGDIIAANRPDPIIHAEKGGNTEGWIKTVQGIIKLNADEFVPGHGDLQTKADIETRLKTTSEKRDKIIAMVKEGKSLDEIRTAMGDPAPAAGRGRGGPAFPSLTETVYNETKK
jgi:glyoxylase-like metal-dependent hydrolase (beta-lactamase superfamily II)